MSDERFVEVKENFFIKNKFIKSVTLCRSNKLNPHTKQIESCRLFQVCIESNSGDKFFEIDEFSSIFQAFLLYFERGLI